MTNLRRAGSIGALLTIVALIFAACGGAASATPTPPGAETPVGEATPVTEATPTPEGGAVVPPGALPTFDVSALTGGIPGVDSYRTTFSIGDELAYEGIVVTQPVLSKSIQTYDDGEPSTAFVIIGDEVWTADGPDGAFTPVPAELGSAMLMAFDPTLMMGAFAGADLAGIGANVGTEDKNGVQAHHVRIDQTTAAGFAASMPAGSSIDIWVADAGYLVAWEMAGFDADSNLSIQVTGVNDPANKVEPPV